MQRIGLVFREVTLMAASNNTEETPLGMPVDGHTNSQSINRVM